MKTDNSVKNICIAAIKRKTTKTYNFAATALYLDTSVTTYMSDILSHVSLNKTELPIASTFADGNWTLVTTQRVITRIDDNIYKTNMTDITRFFPGNFKGQTLITLGTITDLMARKIPCFIQTGNASMVVIYAIKTVRELISTQP